jgi:hypothetical protein
MYMVFKDSLIRRSNFLFLSKTSSFVDDLIERPESRSTVWDALFFLISNLSLFVLSLLAFLDCLIDLVRILLVFSVSDFFLVIVSQGFIDTPHKIKLLVLFFRYIRKYTSHAMFTDWNI